MNTEPSRNGSVVRWSFMLSIAIASVAVCGICLIAQSADSDNDGMNDDYELLFGLDPMNPADAALNYDDDTLSNLQEAALATDPFCGDTDRDQFPDHQDNTPLSRVYIAWGDPKFTTTDAYLYTGPAWWGGASRVGGSWNTNAPSSWVVDAAEPEGVGSLLITVDRNTLTNTVMLKLQYLDQAGASLYVDILDTNGQVVASDLFGNLIAGSGNTVTSYHVIPLTVNPAASGIRLRRGVGTVRIYASGIYTDMDQDKLDREQEEQLGTSDADTDSDDDGLSDYAEAIQYGTDPLHPDTDRDGLSDSDEISRGTNPLSADSDGDGMPDAWEIQYGLNPLVNDAAQDLDGDGVNNLFGTSGDTLMVLAK